jgi:hypothetical protein
MFLSRKSVAASLPQKSDQLAEREAVKNPISRYTTLSGHRDAPTNQIDFRGGMSIGVDAHQAAKLKRTLTPGLGIWGVR